VKDSGMKHGSLDNDKGCVGMLQVLNLRKKECKGGNMVLFFRTSFCVCLAIPNNNQFKPISYFFFLLRIQLKKSLEESDWTNRKTRTRTNYSFIVFFR
jgi:hypothetical protein